MLLLLNSESSIPFFGTLTLSVFTDTHKVFGQFRTVSVQCAAAANALFNLQMAINANMCSLSDPRQVLWVKVFLKANVFFIVQTSKWVY